VSSKFRGGEKKGSRRRRRDQWDKKGNANFKRGRKVLKKFALSVRGGREELFSWFVAAEKRGKSKGGRVSGEGLGCFAKKKKKAKSQDSDAPVWENERGKSSRGLRCSGRAKTGQQLRKGVLGKRGGTKKKKEKIQNTSYVVPHRGGRARDTLPGKKEKANNNND